MEGLKMWLGTVRPTWFAVMMWRNKVLQAEKANCTVEVFSVPKLANDMKNTALIRQIEELIQNSK